MRKVISVIVIILAVAVAGIFLINERKENTDVTQKRAKVGMLMLGSRDD